MDWARILAYITGTVDQELLLRNEYLVAENRILEAQIKIRLRFTDAERVTLAEIAHRLGRKVLEDVANAAKPDTIMGWSCGQKTHSHRYINMLAAVSGGNAFVSYQLEVRPEDPALCFLDCTPLVWMERCFGYCPGWDCDCFTAVA